MNGPRLICIGCGELVGTAVPLCDDCSRFFDATNNEPPCHLCMGGYRLKDNGDHINASGGYVGRCLDFDVKRELKNEMKNDHPDIH